VLISSGPPHSAHLATRRIAERTGIPWVMDWRDPWTFDEFLEGFDHEAFARAERPGESRCVKAASMIVVNTPPVERRLGELYPEARDRITTIANGADPESVPEWSAQGPMRIVYAGSLFRGRDPRIFMRALRDAIHLHGTPAADVRLQFVTGSSAYEGRELSAWAADFGVEGQVEIHGFMPRRRLLEWLAGTAVNVLVQIPSTYQVPAKLFEYVQLPSWLVAVTDAPNAISEMLDGSSAIVVPPDHEALAREFARLYQRWQQGERPLAVNDGRFDRAARAEAMAAVLEKAVSRR
jgi:hypothetical protein